MYLKYFGLNEPPFSITPDPRFVFLSSRHEDALAHLKYGIAQGGGGGFVQLTGEVGTGKTTLCRLLLDELPEDTEAALILNPLLEPTQLLETICEELGVNVRAAWGNNKKLTDRLNQYLLKAHAAGKTVVVVIDEAQNLSPDALEQVRLLTNLETATQKLLQIVLLGQPELRDVLARANLRQLAQRITARYHLQPLDRRETAAYVEHRLRVSGCDANPFTDRALSALYRCTGGVPRLINIVAERSLLAAYARNCKTIGPAIVRRAAAEVRGGEDARSGSPARRWAVAGAGALALAATFGVLWWQTWPQSAPPVAASASTMEDPAPTARAEPPAPETTLPATDFESAWTELLELRGIESDTPGDCQWQVQGLVHCLERRGRVADLLRLKRPVLVAVAGGYGVIQSVGPDAFEWRSDNGILTLGVKEFEARWSGRYWDVWNMPGYVPESLREGDRGPGVLWVKTAAVRAEPKYLGDTQDPYFGPSLTRWAQDFQASMGLPADGLIGRETLQYLSIFVEG